VDNVIFQPGTSEGEMDDKQKEFLRQTLFQMVDALMNMDCIAEGLLPTVSGTFVPKDGSNSGIVMTVGIAWAKSDGD
jgi:hypothetical protein